MVRFSVIIPTFNEEQTVHRCIRHVRALEPAAEIVVADGSSEDDTVRIAQEERVSVCVSDRNRGRQCNAGACLAAGDILLFLHADTKLPTDAFAQLSGFFEEKQVNIGTFRLVFDAQHWLLALYPKLCRFDSKFTRYGDQCIVVRKSFFDFLGGFPEWPLFEDVRLLQVARKTTRVYSFPGTVTTSARRFLDNGILKQYALDVRLIVQYLCGGTPQRLAMQYERMNTDIRDVALIIFARFPRHGEVKTRLAETVGPEAATEFYRSCAEHIFRESGDLSNNVRRFLFHPEGVSEDEMRVWAGSEFQLDAQVGDDLGKRMKHAFYSVFRRGFRKAIVVGTDVPDLSAGVIDDAARALDTCDIVVGPCKDGGYYLLGMKELHEELFTDVPWSTDEVLKRTMEAVNGLGLSLHLLPTLADVDTEEDLRRWYEADTADNRHPVRVFVRSLLSSTEKRSKNGGESS